MSAPHCPSCHATVRPDALWCPLCHLDLRPTPEPLPEATPAVEAVLAMSGNAPAPEGGRHARSTGWPCVPCGTENDLASSTCVTCSSPFLGELHDEASVPVRLPLIGDMTKLGRPAMLGLAVALGVLGTAVLFAVLSIGGALL